MLCLISVHNWSTNQSSEGLFYLFTALGWRATTVELFERQLSVHLERKVWRCFIPNVFTTQVKYNYCWRAVHQHWNSLLAHYRAGACRSLFQVSSTTDDGPSSTNCCLSPDTVMSCVFILSITDRAFMHGTCTFRSASRQSGWTSGKLRYLSLRHCALEYLLEFCKVLKRPSSFDTQHFLPYSINLW